MKKLIRPPCLRPGDTVATVSLSAGLAGEAMILHRYQLGKKRLEEVFGLKVVEMPHTLAGLDYAYTHPKERAEDLMAAFADPSIKGIISCIGGDDSVRLHPYIDYDLIRRNPKLYSGYSDSTVTHLMCFKAGLASQYGPSVLNDFAEYVAMTPYTVKWVQRMWFSAKAPGDIPTSPGYTTDYLRWETRNQNTSRAFKPNGGYEVVQGEGKARGPLIGGCFELIALLRGTPLFPAVVEFDGAILFLETSEEQIPVWAFLDGLRALAAMDILPRLAGILLGKPQAGEHQAEYHDTLRKVLAECGRTDMPVLGNASFGHNEPKHPLPYGVMAEIDCRVPAFSILEAGVVE